MEKKISQMEPWFGAEEKQAVAEYLDAGGWLTEFKKTKELEQMIARYVGSKYAVMVPNGTIALAAALFALGIGKGDEVIVPDYTMIASANAVVLAGAEPIFADIDPGNLCLDIDLAKKAITKKTKAVMLVTINGRHPDMKQWVDFCTANNLALVEDAAQSLGSFCNGRHLGTFGNVGTLSFSMPKVITMGQGGAIMTDSEDIYKKILMVKDFGRQKSGVDLHEAMGYNFKYTDLQAVIGIEQMKKLPFRVERKKEIFHLYRELLSGTAGVEFVATDTRDTSPWFIDILVPAEKREGLMSFLADKGIGSRPFYPAIHTQAPYAHIKGDFPNARAVSARGLWLPSSSFLSDQDVQRVCGAVQAFFNT